MLWRMDRRLFFRTMIGGVAASSAVRTWPFRVLSFPTELRIFSMEELRRIYLERAMAEISRAMADSPLNGGASILCSLPPDLESLY